MLVVSALQNTAYIEQDCLIFKLRTSGTMTVAVMLFLFYANRSLGYSPYYGKVLFLLPHYKTNGFVVSVYF